MLQFYKYQKYGMVIEGHVNYNGLIMGRVGDYDESDDTTEPDFEHVFILRVEEYRGGFIFTVDGKPKVSENRMKIMYEAFITALQDIMREKRKKDTSRVYVHIDQARLNDKEYLLEIINSSI